MERFRIGILQCIPRRILTGNLALGRQLTNNVCCQSQEVDPNFVLVRLGLQSVWTPKLPWSGKNTDSAELWQVRRCSRCCWRCRAPCCPTRSSQTGSEPKFARSASGVWGAILHSLPIPCGSASAFRDCLSIGNQDVVPKMSAHCLQTLRLLTHISRAAS